MIGVKSKQGIPTRTWGWITSFLWREKIKQWSANAPAGPIGRRSCPRFRRASRDRPLLGAGFLRRVLGNRAKHFGRSFCRGGEAILRRVRGSRERTGCAGLAHLCRRAAERIDSRSRRGDPAERGQGVQWMPWHWRTMKDARYCEKPRGAVSGLRSAGIRMGEPGRGHTRPSLLGREDHPGNRNIQVPGGREREFDSVSSGERKRISPNRGDPGYGPPRRPGGRRSGRAWKGPAERVTPPYARAEDPGRAVPE